MHCGGTYVGYLVFDFGFRVDNLDDVVLRQAPRVPLDRYVHRVRLRKERKNVNFTATALQANELTAEGYARIGRILHFAFCISHFFFLRSRRLREENPIRR